jgi:hypothetical protein
MSPPNSIPFDVELDPSLIEEAKAIILGGLGEPVDSSLADEPAETSADDAEAEDGFNSAS